MSESIQKKDDYCKHVGYYDDKELFYWVEENKDNLESLGFRVAQDNLDIFLYDL